MPRNRPIMLACIVLTLAVVPAVGHEGAMGIVKERMDLMSDLGKTMKAMKTTLASGGAIDGPTLTRQAAVIRDHSGHMPMLFPAGSYDPPSEALPAIDTRRGEFDALADRLGAQADGLEAIAAAPDRAALEDWFRETGRVCSACHKDFRAKK